MGAVMLPGLLSMIHSGLDPADPFADGICLAKIVSLVCILCNVQTAPAPKGGGAGGGGESSRGGGVAGPAGPAGPAGAGSSTSTNENSLSSVDAGGEPRSSVGGGPSGHEIESNGAIVLQHRDTMDALRLLASKSVDSGVRLLCSHLVAALNKL